MSSVMRKSRLYQPQKDENQYSKPGAIDNGSEDILPGIFPFSTNSAWEREIFSVAKGDIFYV